MRIALFFVSCLLLSMTMVSAGESSGYTIDDNFPGGNITIVAQDNNVILVKPDRRGTDKSECGNRYWCFRVKNAQGQKLSFQFLEDVNSNKYGHVTPRGPIVSRDGGLTWDWLSSGKKSNLPNSFEYTFGKDEKEVYFAVSYPYTQENLNRFLQTLDKNQGNFRVETLCKSEKGKDVLKLRFGSENSPKKVGVLICARHHANEVLSNFVVEGIVREALSGSETGKFLLVNADFFIIPIVDFDGVEKGAQRQSRYEHDYNRDYVEAKFFSVQAIQKQTREWAQGKQVIVFDFHANSLDICGKRLCDPKEWSHNMFFLVHSKKCLENERKFGTILKPLAKGQAVLYDSKTDLASDHFTLAVSHIWFSENLNALYSTSSEVPSCPASGMPHTDKELREFGSTLAKAIAQYIKVLPEKPNAPEKINPKK